MRPRTAVLGVLAFFTPASLALVYQSCASGQLTVEQASAQMDVACDVLARALTHQSEPKVEQLRAQVCNSARTRQLMEKVLVQLESENDAGADFLLEPFPFDAGH